MRGRARLAFSAPDPESARGGVRALVTLGEEMPALPSPGSQQAPTTSSSLTFAPWVREEGTSVMGACLALHPSLGLCLGNWVSMVRGEFHSQVFGAAWRQGPYQSAQGGGREL